MDDRNHFVHSLGRRWPRPEFGGDATDASVGQQNGIMDDCGNSGCHKTYKMIVRERWRWHLHTGFDTVVFGLVTAAIKFILSPIGLLLRIIYIPCQILIVPLMLLLFLFSVAWLLCLGVIMGCGAIARSCWLLRPVAFMLALPFVVIGAALIAIAPMPSPASIIDQQEKLHILLSYPDFK